MATPTLAEQVSVISEAATEDLSDVWDLLSPSAVIEALFDLLPALVDTWATAAGSLTADWYDDLREERNVKGRFHAIVPDLGDLGAEELALWGVEPINQDEPDFALVRTRIEGGLQRRVTNTSRATVMTSSVEDPGATGWQRIARPDGCAFCVMLAGRGHIYTKKGANFGAHDHCNCSAIPAWGGQPVPVKPYKPSERNITDADRARLREWLKANGDGENKPGASTASTRTRASKPTESKRDIAARHLPALEKRLKELRAQGLPADSPQIQYHLTTIARLRAQLNS